MASRNPADAHSRAKAGFARRVRAIMEEKGLSGSETARRMGEHLPGGFVSPASISHYRSGRVIPRQPHLDALCSALGVEASELLRLAEGANLGQAEPTIGVSDPNPHNQHDQHGDTADGPGAVLVENSAPGCSMQPIGIEDFGDEVHLRISQRMPWDMALAILDVLKRR